MAAGAARPTVDDVALLLRARTKDSYGNEVGTFDQDTRPTDVQVEEQIDVATVLVGMRLPPVCEIADELLPAVAAVIAYRAALRVEKAYYPEQVDTGRSPYDQLLAEYMGELEALVDAVRAGGTEGFEGHGIASLPIRSWTMQDTYYPPLPGSAA